MSDLIIGTIIGGSIGVIGSLLGFIIQGHYSKKSTELQIQARREEQKQQFENERKAVQITRLIEKREPYLGPINEQFQTIIESIHGIEKNINSLVHMCGDDNLIVWANTSSSERVDAMMFSLRNISSATDRIEILRVRNSDKKLADYLVNTLKLSIDIFNEAMKIQHLEIKHSEGDMGENPNKEISDQCITVLNLTPKMNDSIRECNRRIEEILSGIE